MSVEFVFDPDGANELTLSDSEIASYNPVKIHTGKSDLRANLNVPLETVRGFAQRQDRLNVSIDGTVEWTGYVMSVSETKSRGQTTLQADGIAKRLEETRPNSAINYQSIALQDAIRDYWGRTPFSNYNITNQDVELVATNQIVQDAISTSEWDAILPTPSATDPWQNNGGPELLQSLIFQQTQDNDDKTAVIIRTGTEDIAEQAENNRYHAHLDLNAFTAWQNLGFNYDIPDTASKVAIRAGAENGASNNLVTNATTRLALQFVYPSGADDFTVINTGAISNNEGDFTWFQFDLSKKLSSSDVYDVQAFIKGDEFDDATSSGDGFAVDCIAVYDDRFFYNFDDTVESGQNYTLAGPQLYPTVNITLNSETAGFNIAAAEIRSIWNDTLNNELAVKLSGSYLTETSTDNLDKTFSNQVGRKITPRVKLTRFGSRDTATPREGYKGQAIDEWELLVDLDDLAVIDDLTLSRSHFQNLLTLHGYGDFQWTIEHDASDIANITVESYPRGRKLQSKIQNIDDELEKTKEVQASDYYNTIYIEGQKDSQGNRPSNEATDQPAIDNDGRKISPGVLRDLDISTEAGAIFRSERLLDIATNNDAVRGTVSLAPKDFVEPGYAYPVDMDDDSDDENLIAEEVSYSESTDSVRERIRFVPPIDLAQEIQQLRQNSRQQGDLL